ncbi:MAG: Ada metal-binding domain-containing protein [Prosthecochloris sp.]|nr:Ada metal-binding domain-containing protein [Prosthecochloris sp.]
MQKGRWIVTKVVAWLVVLLLSMQVVIASENSATVYHGNTKSKIFHHEGCRYFNCSKCKAVFSSRQSAVDSGYRPCRVCKP